MGIWIYPCLTVQRTLCVRVGSRVARYGMQCTLETIVWMLLCIEDSSLMISWSVSIVCLTQVWQPLFPLFCDKTFKFAIQTWQTTLEHYYVYVQTYFLSQHRKMLILLISSCCKMCTLLTIRSRVFVCCEQYEHARLYCWQWAHFTIGPNEQNQHFAKLRQKYVCTYT